MALFPDDQFACSNFITYYPLSASDVFMELQVYAQDRFFIVNGADLEYTKTT